MPTVAQRPSQSADGGLRPLLEALPEKLATHVLDVNDTYSLRSLADLRKRHGLGNESPSTLSRWAKKAARQLIGHVNGRDLEHLNLAAIVMDGAAVGGRTQLWAMGITMDGTKIPLGVVEGRKVETKKLVSDLLHNLVHERHLDVTDTLWMIDGGRALRSAINEFTNGRATIQRCVVHKNRNVIWQNLPAKERRRIGKRVRKSLHKAWLEPDPEKAAELLEETAGWLERQGHDESAKSVREGADLTLTLKKLGLGGGHGWRAIWKALSTTNAIESVHGYLVRWTKAQVTHWRPDDHRQRSFVSALACAERSWDPVAVGRAMFEQMQLAMLRARNADVEIELTNASDRLTLSRFRVADELQKRAYPALGELVRWADRNDRVVEVTPDALDLGESGKRLRRALNDRGFIPNVEEGAEPGALIRAPRPRAQRVMGRGTRARGRQRNARVQDEPGRSKQAPAVLGGSQDALARFQETVGDDLLFGIGDLALKASPAMVRLSDDELGIEARRLEVAHAGVVSLEREVGEWWDENFEDAAKKIALERERVRRRERPPHHPLENGRRHVLGADRAQELMGRSAYLGGLLEGSGPDYLKAHEAAVGEAFTGLDALVERVDRAARAVAAVRERDRRQLVRAVEDRVRAAGPSVPDGQPTGGDAAPSVDPVERHARSLGSRADAFRDYAEAIVERIRKAKTDPAALRELQQGIGAPWKRLAGTGALRTARLEQRSAATLNDRCRALWEQGQLHKRARERGASKPELERAAVCGKTGDKLRDELRSINGELAQERAKQRSLDRFVAEPSGAAMDAAITIELGRRRQLELGQAVVSQVTVPTVIEQPPPEPAVGMET